LGVEHGRLEVEVEVALAARGQRDLAAAERTLADDLGEAGAGGGFGQGGFPGGFRRGAIYRRFPGHSSADLVPSTAAHASCFRRGAPWKARVVRPGGSGVRRPKPLWGNRMTIELHTWNTPNGRKISVALEEMGLP